MEFGNIYQADDLGHISEGAEADLAVLSIRKGNFGFIDAGGNRLDGDRRLEAEMTIRAGRIVWDQNGIAARTGWIIRLLNFNISFSQ